MAISSIFTNSRKSEPEVISDLRAELRRTQAQLQEAKLKLAEANADNARLRDAGRQRRAVPHGDAESGYECPVRGCYAPLEEDYRHCPGCGAELDWGHWEQPFDPDVFDGRCDR